MSLFSACSSSGCNRAPGTSTADLLRVGKQLHRLNGLYIRLVETALEAATRDRLRD